MPEVIPQSYVRTTVDRLRRHDLVYTNLGDMQVLDRYDHFEPRWITLELSPGPDVPLVTATFQPDSTGRWKTILVAERDIHVKAIEARNTVRFPESIPFHHAESPQLPRPQAPVARNFNPIPQPRRAIDNSHVAGTTNWWLGLIIVVFVVAMLLFFFANYSPPPPEMFTP